MNLLDGGSSSKAKGQLHTKIQVEERLKAPSGGAGRVSIIEATPVAS